MPSPLTKDQDPASLSTATAAYATRLKALESVWWKRLLDVQAPYRWNLRRLNLGYTLDLGCGLGRNLAHLRGHGIGIDHNAAAVATALERGLTAFTPEAFRQQQQEQAYTFDSLLFAHVAEHMSESACVDLLKSYLSLVKAGGQVVLITPQEAGQASDPTHVTFMDFGKLRTVARQLDLEVVRTYSFPLPRLFGPLFKHNEFVLVARRF